MFMELDSADSYRNGVLFEADLRVLLAATYLECQDILSSSDARDRLFAWACRLECSAAEEDDEAVRNAVSEIEEQAACASCCGLCSIVPQCPNRSIDAEAPPRERV